MIDDGKTLAVIEEIERASRRSRPYMAIGLLGFLMAFILLIVLVEREQRHTQEMERLTRDTRILQSRLNLTLEQLQLRPNPQLVNQALRQAQQVDASLAQIQDVTRDGPPPTNGSRLVDPTGRPLTGPPPERVTPRVIALNADNPRGWDVDVFWCEGAGQASNYSIARRTSLLLSQLARNRRRIGPGISLGRIRMAPQPPDKAGPEPGSFIMSDTDAGETQAAGALGDYLRSQGLAFRPTPNAGSRSAFYISVYACATE